MRPTALRLLVVALMASPLATPTVLAQVPGQQTPQPVPVAAATPSPVAAPVAVAPAVPVVSPSTPGPAIASPQGIPPPAQAPRPDDRAMLANVRVEVIITDQTGSAQAFRKAVSLTTALGEQGMIRSEIQVPMPSTTFTPAKEGSDSKPLTSYSYRSMSLNLDVRDVRVEGSRVRLRLGVEYSPVDEKTAEASSVQGLASLARFQQTLTLVLDDGKPLVVAQSSDPVPTRDRKITLEAKATILK